MKSCLFLLRIWIYVYIYGFFVSTLGHNFIAISRSNCIWQKQPPEVTSKVNDRPAVGASVWPRWPRSAKGAKMMYANPLKRSSLVSLVPNLVMYLFSESGPRTIGSCIKWVSANDLRRITGYCKKTNVVNRFFRFTPGVRFKGTALAGLGTGFQARVTGLYTGMSWYVSIWKWPTVFSWRGIHPWDVVISISLVYQRLSTIG